MARIVVCHAFPDPPCFLSSTVFLVHATLQIDELTREQVGAERRRMERLVIQIRAEQNWFPASIALCPWCPFYQQGCSLYPTPTEGPDITTRWLEGAA